MSLLDWVHSTIGVNRQYKDEIKTNCPKCSHENFYFNINKRVGWCHSAGCHWKPRLSELIEHVGYGPDEVGFYQPKLVPVVEAEITLPAGSLPILFYDGPTLMTNNEIAYEYLRGRGLDDRTILRFEIQFKGSRIYLPVRLDSKLESYVSRDIGRKGYLYPPGGRHGRTFLGWDECKYWESLVLVENSFVSLWLRGENCSTNFGSHLSDEQIEKIAGSRIKQVTIIWDEGAEGAAEKAVRALRNVGIRAIFIRIAGQPDNYPYEKVVQLIERARANSSGRATYIQ